MVKKIIPKLILILIIIIVASIIIFLYKPKVNSPDCLDINSFKKVNIVSCYDSEHQLIKLRISKTDSYSSDTNLKIGNKTLSIEDKVSQELNISSEKLSNFSVLIKLKSKDAEFCEETKTFNLPECNPQISIKISEGENNALNSTVIIDDSDTLPVELIDPNSLWTPSCNSVWVCRNWEQCQNSVQKRTCEDKSNCLIQTNLPDFTRNCNICQENWKCSWSSCAQGLTSPTCSDLNNCGTSFSIPKPIPCTKKDCSPDIQCTDWSDCKPDYKFIDLNNINLIKGIKTRVCRDKNNCVLPSYNEEECSARIDVVVKKVSKCSQNYTQIYNKLTGELLSTIKNSDSDKPTTDIYLYEAIPSEFNC